MKNGLRFREHSLLLAVPWANGRWTREYSLSLARFFAGRGTLGRLGRAEPAVVCKTRRCRPVVGQTALHPKPFDGNGLGSVVGIFRMAPLPAESLCAAMQTLRLVHHVEFT